MKSCVVEWKRTESAAIEWKTRVRSPGSRFIGAVKRWGGNMKEAVH